MNGQVDVDSHGPESADGSSSRSPLAVLLCRLQLLAPESRSRPSYIAGGRCSQNKGPAPQACCACAAMTAAGFKGTATSFSRGTGFLTLLLQMQPGLFGSAPVS